MIIYKGFYTTDNSDLLIKVVSVAFSCDEYIKAKLILTNKKNGILYHDAKYYKLQRELISHWIRLN
jgi:hypothetical protein